MCCRVAQGSAKDKVKKKVKAKGQAPDVAARLNLAPTQDALVAVHESGDTQLEAMRWGLIPPWAKDKSIGAKLANARAETIDEKPSFRKPFQRRRCLLPVDGYYEWESRPSGKQPVLPCRTLGNLDDAGAVYRPRIAGPGACPSGVRDAAYFHRHHHHPQSLGQARARTHAGNRASG